MAKFMRKAVLGATLAATALTAAAPADAQRWRRHHRDGDVATGAIIGGIVGLGLGAAIASSNRRDRYYDRRYYYDRGYYPQYDYYDPYYQPRYRDYYRNQYRPRCYTVRQYDPYYDRRIRTRVCD